MRCDFNRLAVYLSFRTPIGGKLPPPPASGGATAGDDGGCTDLGGDETREEDLRDDFGRIARVDAAIVGGLLHQMPDSVVLTAERSQRDHSAAARIQLHHACATRYDALRDAILTCARKPT